MKFRQFRESFGVFRAFMREAFRMAWAVWRLSRLHEPRVSIFGGSMIQPGSQYAIMAHELTKKLAAKHISVITGGGPGIMEAACEGTKIPGNGQSSIGITITSLAEVKNAPCAEERIVMSYFWSRKWLLVNYSVAYVIFPGGFGTFDELAEVSTLIQTAIITPEPIVLIGKEYWRPFMEQIDTALRAGLLKEKDRNLIVVTDDIDEAAEIVSTRCRNIEACKIALQRF